jgi:hypothetical protein
VKAEASSSGGALAVSDRAVVGEGGNARGCQSGAATGRGEAAARRTAAAAARGPAKARRSRRRLGASFGAVGVLCGDGTAGSSAAAYRRTRGGDEQ